MPSFSPDDSARTHRFPPKFSREEVLLAINEIKIAIETCQHDLLRYSEEEYPPLEYAKTNLTLGKAFRALARFSAKPLKLDAKANSCDIIADQISRQLGDRSYRENRTSEAIESYKVAISATENKWSHATKHRQEPKRVIAESLNLVVNLVKSYADEREYDKALEEADRFRTRSLARLLYIKNYQPKGGLPPQVLDKLDKQLSMQARNEHLNNSPKLGIQRGPDIGQLIHDEINLIDPTFKPDFKPLEYDEIKSCIFQDERTALLYWYVAGRELIAFILSRDAPMPACRRYSEGKLRPLIEAFDEYIVDYRSDRVAWVQKLPLALQKLSNLLEMDSLASQIAKCAPAADQLILVPHRFLHLLPLHCLPLADPTTTLQDQFARGVRFAPSLQVLNVVQQRQQTPLQRLFAVQNPTQDLVYSDLEVYAIQPMFTEHTAILKQDKATRSAFDHIRPSIAASSCLHFACHGFFNFEKPQLSALILAGSSIQPAPPEADPNRYLLQRDGSALDLSQCLTLLDLFQLDLRQARLVALSACETGLSEINSPSDEFVALSSGFLYAGCNSVIGTLWIVDDLSTGLLMAEFYRLLKQQEQTQPFTDVALALKQAQQWLRQLTCAEAVATLQRLVPSLDADGQETAKRSIRRSLSEGYAADDRPYHHPFYWAAFCAVGQ
jgi:CHAT domain-containing protein